MNSLFHETITIITQLVIRNLRFSFFAEVFWHSNAYHRGGYAYRLCKIEKVWDYTSGITEECFQKGHLKFAGRWHFESVLNQK